MSSCNSRHPELCELLEALCEDRLSPGQASRLEELVLADADARRLYLEYVDLHGSLFWDTAAVDRGQPSMPAVAPETAAEGRRIRHRSRTFFAAVLATGVLAAVGVFVVQAWRGPDVNQPIAAPDQPRDVPERVTITHPESPSDTPQERPSGLESTVAVAPKPQVPGSVAGQDGPHPSDGRNDPPKPSSSEAIVAFVNRQLQAGWHAAGVTPSAEADDAEWLRRVYLDVVGHIPPVDVAEQFLANDSPDKRRQLVDRLLDDPGYVRHWTTIWANLLVGRSEPQNINRPALERYLRRSFAENRPWSEMVSELIAAEGDSEEVGATNFLLAHLNDQATPATAITARLFLGTQLSCVQCHDHPSNDLKQDEYWSLNAFFQQSDVERRRRERGDGRMVTEVSLVSRPIGGATYFEDRRGYMQATFPKFSGVEVDSGPSTNRRRELARLIVDSDDLQAARAVVNRLWAHYLGYGFTRPVDDMGPHNPPTHPELLDRLAREFVLHDYDLKELTRWITGSRAYALTSRYHAGNESDQPDQGAAPLFSRMYVKHMSPEQLFDSLLVATQAHLAAGSDWDAVARMRTQWLQQFVIAFGTDENDEATTFEASVSQALMMMNGSLTGRAVEPKSGTFLAEVLGDRSGEAEKVRRLCLAALSRYPTSSELAALRNILREGAGNPAARAEGLQDLFWAYLNSGEFVLVH